MATRQQIEHSFPASARLSQSALNRLLRPLAADGRIPSTPLGKSGIHLDNGHLAWMLLALAAPEPHLVIPTVTKLARLDPEHPRPGSTDLHTGLSIAIAARGSAIHQGIERERTGSPLGWEVALSSDPLFAWMRWNVDGQELREYYVDHDVDPAITARERSRGMLRLTVITEDVLQTVGEYYADSLAYAERYRRPIGEPGVVRFHRSRA